MQLRALSLVLALFGSASLTQGQWTTFHGNAQRDGQAPANGPVAINPAWIATIGGPIISSPVVGPDGTIYLGSVLEDDLHPSHSIVALDPNGSIKWRFATGFRDDQTLSTPAIGPDGTLYVGAQDGGFYALNPDGSLRWKHQATTMVRQHPVIAPDGTVYVGIDGRLTAFQADGTVLWQSAAADMDFPGGPSLGSDGTIYIGAGTFGMKSKLVAFAPDGSVKWTYTFGNNFYFVLAPPTIGNDGTIFCSTTKLHAIRPDGTLKWSKTLVFGDTHYGSAAVDAQGFVYYAGLFTVWKIAPNGSTVWKYDLQSGANLGSSWSSPLVDPAGRVYVGLGTGVRYAIPLERNLLALNPNGTKLFEADLGTIASTSAPAMGPDGTIYIGNLAGELRSFAP